MSVKGTHGLYEQIVEFRFDAAHSLRGYEGACARLHGHSYRVQVSLQGDRLDEVGMLMDFRRLKAVCREVIDKFDHVYLNEVPPFDRMNPTCENIARHLYGELSQALADAPVCVAYVTIWETPTSAVTYAPEATK